MAKAQEKILLESADAADFEHHGNRGDERAASLAQFFERRLPARFGVGKAEAIDYRDKRTGQLDLVIYDCASSAPIRVGNENLLLPAESLNCLIYVKTTVTQVELNTSYKAAGKVRGLRPFKSQVIPPREDGSAATDDRARCLYVLFGYTSNLANDDQWMDKENMRLLSAATAAKVTPDCIDRLFILDRGIISPMKVGKWEQGVPDSIFLDTYLHIVNFLNRESRRRQPVDWQIYGPRSSPGWKPLNGTA